MTTLVKVDYIDPWICIVAGRYPTTSNFIVLCLCITFPPGWFVEMVSTIYSRIFYNPGEKNQGEPSEARRCGKDDSEIKTKH